MLKRVRRRGYLIGVDVGATKTVAALADLEGEILKTAKTGSANPRNVGIAKAAENILKAINKLKAKEVLSACLGLPAVEEEYKNKKAKIKKEILKRVSFNNLKIESDQLIAFRSGTDKKNGMVIIAGTGCAVHGWKGKRQAKAGGWGWVADEGSGFWAGQKFCQELLKELDGRSPKATLPKIKKSENLLRKIYTQDPIKSVSYFSILCDKAAKRGNKKAREIIREGAEEIVLSANTVIKKLNFQKEKFPIVLVGGMFKSDIFLKTVKSQLRSLAPKAIFIRPKKGPITGALKLAGLLAKK